jgi:hypothetical protein
VNTVMDAYDMVLLDLRKRRNLVQKAIDAVETLRPDLAICTINVGRRPEDWPPLREQP